MLRVRLLVAGFLGVAVAAAAQNLPPRWSFEIATGPVAGTYFPAGELIARVVSHPPGLARCEKSPLCGPPGMIATARSSEGAVANVLAVNAGRSTSGLVPGNVLADAVAGQGHFRKDGRQTHVRVMADLFTEQILLVTAKRSSIRSVVGLKGKRVSLGRTSADLAQAILTAYRVKRVKSVREPYDASVALLRGGKIDAFFVRRAASDPAVTGLLESGQVRLVPIDGKGRTRFLARVKGTTAETVAAGVYPATPRLDTVGTHTYWIVQDVTPPDAVYALVRALYHPGNRSMLDHGNSRIRPGSAASLQWLPLHPGAVRYWREVKVLPKS